MTTDTLDDLYRWLLNFEAIAPDTTPETLTQLTRLNLAAKDIDTLHPALAQLHKLLHLDLRRNRIKHLPEWFHTLPLASLNLSGNRLQSIGVLQSMTTLRVLDLSANTLSELNHSFDQMHLLHSLNLSFNALTSFSIAPLASLSHLDLSNNFLTALDPSINTLEELISLNLSNNTIATLHIKHGFELLDKLDLSSNSMLELSLSGCEMLERLNIDDNPGINVTFAPNFAPALLHYSALGCEFSRWCTPPSKALHTLAMASNNLTSVHVHDYHQLCELDLEENAIEYLYEELRHLKHLDTLFIDANPLHDEEYARIASLGILHCDIDIKSSILIDVARSEDIDAMARLLAQLFAIEQDFTIDFEIQKQGLHQLIKHPGAILHVARLHDRVVGMITMQELISTAQGGAIGAIEDLVVDNAFRNFGIGYKLLESMIEKAKQLQYGRVQLSADMHNERALAFYRRYGFLKTRLNAYHFSL